MKAARLRLEESEGRDAQAQANNAFERNLLITLRVYLAQIQGRIDQPRLGLKELTGVQEKIDPAIARYRLLPEFNGSLEAQASIRGIVILSIPRTANY